MHEVALAQRMVDIAVNAAGENGGGRVIAARLLLGSLSGAEPDTLTFAFEIATRGTCAAGCVLHIVKIPARLRCWSCRREEERDLPDPCPACGTAGGEVLAGRELRLDTIELDKDSDDSGSNK